MTIQAGREAVDDRSSELVARWQQGDARAEVELFHNYVARLVALARSRLSEKLARRLDAEDVVQSAFRSFFAGLRQGRYKFPERGDLWRLLATITLRKLYRQAHRHAAGKRALDRERPFEAGDDGCGLPAEKLAGDPSPEEAAALADELEDLLRNLAPMHRTVLELRLEGHNQNQIAAVIQRSQRTVRRLLDEIKTQLEQRCQRSFGGEGA